MQIDCFRAKIVFVIAIIDAITTIGTLTLPVSSITVESLAICFDLRFAFAIIKILSNHKIGKLYS